MMNNNTLVLKTNAGRHFHLFGDCSALETGRRNSEKAGREIHVEWMAPLSEVLEDGMFGCRVCHKRAGEAIRPEADLRAIRAQRAAARLAKRAAMVETAPAVETVEAPAPVQSSVAIQFSDGTVATKAVQKSVVEQVKMALAPLFTSPFDINVTLAPMGA